MPFALLTVLAALLCGGTPTLAQNSLAQNSPAQDSPVQDSTVQDSSAQALWRISKSSGDVSVSTAGMQLVTLKNGMTLQAGDAIRTGQNGRVLLTRGDETILISANSAISIPKDRKDGLSTTILQQAGSILLEVEKRGVKHFEVETPHLSAVVKGTRFHVSISGNDSRVGVFRGQVEVTDFRSGQHTLINPGQSATVSLQGPAGLSVSGTGPFSPIEQGAPQQSAPPAGAPVDELSPAAPIQRQVLQHQARTPLPGEIQTVALPERAVAERDGWGAGLTAMGERTLSGKREADMLSLAFPFVIGTVVAMAIAVGRRRRRRLEQASGQ